MRFPAMRLGVGLLTSWRFIYVIILIVWSILLASNQIDNKDEWSKIFSNTTVAADNWVHVGSGIGLGCGIVVFLMAGAAMAWDNGQMTNRSPKKGFLQRILFDFACNMASMCIVSVSSIYLYVNRNENKDDVIAGMPWAVVVGGIFLAVSVIDALLFKPTMAYLEFMSSPCVARAVQPKATADTTQEHIRAPHFMQRYLQGIVPLMPYLGTLGFDEISFKGMPVSTIVVGPSSMDDRNSSLKWYKEAALELIQRLETMYNLNNTTKSIPPAGVNNPIAPMVQEAVEYA